MKSLKAAGYYTVGMYPVEKTFFNAQNAYQSYGFDEMLSGNEIGNQTEGTWHDRLDSAIVSKYFNKLDEIKKRVAKPLFVMGLTIYNHGPHNQTPPKTFLDQVEAQTELKLMNADQKPLIDYLHRIDDLNKAHQSIFTEMRKRQSPMLFMSFGDHLPSLDGTMSKVNFKASYKIDRAQTYYRIWSNFKTPRAFASQDMDVAFLGPSIYEALCLPKDPLIEVNSAMRRACSGLFYNCDDAAVASYRKELYDRLNVVTE